MRGRWAWATAAALLVAAAFLLRLPAISEPLGIDQGLWASGARALSRGQVLYQDFWDHKPPGIFLTYLAVFNVFGWRASSVAWTDLLAALAVTALLFAVVRRESNTVTGALAAVLYATLTMPAWLYSHGGFLERAVNETFITVCAAAAALAASRARQARAIPALVALGLFGGAAVIYKPNAGIYLPALMAWAWLYRGRGPGDGRQAASAAAIVVAAALVVPASVILWLWTKGILGEAWVASIAYNLAYVGGGGEAAPNHALAYAKAIWLRLKTDPLWLAGGVGCVAAAWQVAVSKRLEPLPALAIAWGAAAAVAIYANGAWLFNAYFSQALAPLAILAAWLVAGLWHGPAWRRGLASLAALLMVALLVTRGYPARVWSWSKTDVDALVGRLDRVSHLERFGGYANARGYSARANDELVTYLRARTGLDDAIYLFGINGVEVYFSADRRVAQRFLRTNYFLLIDYPDPRFTLRAVAGELAAARPVYIVFERLHSRSSFGRASDALPSSPEIVDLLNGYRREAVIEDFTLYRRVD